MIIEKVAKSNDELLEKSSWKSPLLLRKLRRSDRQYSRGQIRPILSVHPRNQGIHFLMEIFAHMPPSSEHEPISAITKDGETDPIAPEEDGPLAAVVFKTIADPLSVGSALSVSIPDVQKQ